MVWVLSFGYEIISSSTIDRNRTMGSKVICFGRPDVGDGRLQGLTRRFTEAAERLSNGTDEENSSTWGTVLYGSMCSRVPHPFTIIDIPKANSSSNPTTLCI